MLKTKDGYLQGYNAQAVVTIDQFVVAAQATNLAMHAPAFAPMVTAASDRPTTRNRGRHADFKLAADDQSSVESDHGLAPAS